MRLLIGNTNNQLLNLLNGKGYKVGSLPSLNNKMIKSITIPYSLDNGAYSCYLNGQKFDGDRFIYHLEKTLSREENKPLWLVVPDVVGNRIKTIRNWRKWHDILIPYKIDLAFAVQDGMTANDVPGDADLIFVGGTTEWKVETMPYWASLFPRVHVARVNGWQRLIKCWQLGVESIDGTGYFRKGYNPLKSSMVVDLFLFLLLESSNVIVDNPTVLSPNKRKLLLFDYLGIKEMLLQDLPLLQLLNNSQNLCTG